MLTDSLIAPYERSNIFKICLFFNNCEHDIVRRRDESVIKFFHFFYFHVTSHIYKVVNPYYQYLVVTALFMTAFVSLNYLNGNAGSNIALLPPINTDHEED